MAKRKAPELSPEAQAANAAGEAGRERERRARQANAEKQKRFRENMKADGFRQVLLWDFPFGFHPHCRLLIVAHDEATLTRMFTGMSYKTSDRNRFIDQLFRVCQQFIQCVDFSIGRKG